MDHKELKKTRESLGFNIKQMSNALGISRNTYDNWEKGRASVPPVAVRSIENIVMIHAMYDATKGRMDGAIKMKESGINVVANRARIKAYEQIMGDLEEIGLIEE